MGMEDETNPRTPKILTRLHPDLLTISLTNWCRKFLKPLAVLRHNVLLDRMKLQVSPTATTLPLAENDDGPPGLNYTINTS